MKFMPGHGVGAGFAGAVMAKHRKTIPATVNVARVHCERSYHFVIAV